MERLKFVKGQQKRFLQDSLKFNDLTLSSAAKLLNVSETTLKRWLREERTLPVDVFFKMCKIAPKLKIYENKIKEKLPGNWGQVKGGNSRIQNIQDIHKVLEQVRAIRDKRRLESAFLIKRKTKIKNKLLHTLLRSKVNLKFILATCLLTDGSLTIHGNSYRIAYYTKDEVLKRFMKALLSKLSRFMPSETLSKDDVYAIRVNDIYLAKELLSLSPNYTKTPRRGQSKEDYLSEVQPSLNFLKNADEKTIGWCIRFAFSADGCISVSNNSIELNLACYHPTLSTEWMHIIKSYEIFGHLGKEKTSWSGVDGIRIYDLNSIKNFAKLGGFIPGVLITNKSKRYKGLEKNMLLRQVTGGP